MAPTPNSTLTTVEELIAFGLQVFLQIFSLFHTQGVPVAAAPALITQMQATPGLTAQHQAVVETAVTQAVAAHAASTA